MDDLSLPKLSWLRADVIRGCDRKSKILTVRNGTNALPQKLHLEEIELSDELHKSFPKIFTTIKMGKALD